MATNENLSAEHTLILQRAVRFVSRFTVPIYGFHDSQGLFLNRTGVLLKVAGHSFVLTAAHDIQHCIDNSVYLCMARCKDRPLPIPLVDAKFLLSECHDNDVVRDIAAIHLTPDEAEQIPACWEFLTLANVDSNSTENDAFYIASGFPCAWFQLEKWADPTPMPYLGQRVHNITSNSYDPAVHLALGFGRDAIRWTLDRDNADEERLPEIFGMSGCGIWKVVDTGESLGAWNESAIRLVAIQHRCKHDEYILGTWLRHVVERISVEYPDVQRASSIRYS